MPTRRRKIEVHHLTISGLPENTPYGRFLRDLRGNRPVAEVVRRTGEKSHALNEALLRNHRLRLRFFSFTKGHRPDVLDTTLFSLLPNPLSSDQTNVEWTHVLGGLKGDRYVFLIERNTSGIWPSTIGYYLQWLVDEFNLVDEEDENGDAGPVTVSLEAEPGPEFLERMEALDRITEATVRVVRPNPGWRDLQNILGDKAGESDARKVDISMSARRRASLNRRGGIIGWIREAFTRRHLDFAEIKGWRAGQSETFNTTKLGKHATVELEVDDQGQIVPDDAWTTLSGIMDSLD